MNSLHKSPTISQTFLRGPKVYKRAWNTFTEKKTCLKKLESKSMQES